MKVAPFRALTHLLHDVKLVLVLNVEMKVAPFRALTQQYTCLRQMYSLLLVEMKVAPFRALTP